MRLQVPGTEQFVYARAETSDIAAFRHVFGGAYDFELPTEPRLVLDLGANVGYAALYFALKYPATRVLAVEPEPSNAALLRRNVASTPRIEAIEAAAWPRPGRLALADPGKGYWGMRVQAAQTGDVKAVTVSELLERAGAEWVDLVKIDIEGSELELFSGETDWIKRVGALVLELHDRFRPGCRDALDQALGRSGVSFREERWGEDVLFVRVDF